MEEVISILIILGGSLLFWQFGMEYQMSGDDKYICKQSKEEIIRKYEEKKNNGEITLSEKMYLNIRIFLRSRILYKIGAILICIGIILKIIF